jgi:hypothetical protein
MWHIFSNSKKTLHASMDGAAIAKLARRLPRLGIKVLPGLSQAEIENINHIFKVDMPQDLQELLRICVPIGRRGESGRSFFNWHENPQEIYNQIQDKIMGSLRFDITEGQYWSDAFGERPDGLEEAIAQAQKVVADFPALFPVYGHRYMPSVYPGEHPPVISFHQFVDVIVYGDNLHDYFINEFELPLEIISTDEVLVEDVPYWGPSFNADDA